MMGVKWSLIFLVLTALLVVSAIGMVEFRINI